MCKYLMILTPQEMYFFGNEKSFVYPDKSVNKPSYRYYIKSEYTPSQTTLLGTLRYILLPVKKEYKYYTSEDIAQNNAVVGSKSFCYGEENSFGKIRKISPMFLMHGNDQLVVTPFDHAPGNPTYTPYTEYTTVDNDFIYPKSYDAKEGLPESYMRVRDGKIFDFSEIFNTETRVGINCSEKKKGFFKKEYVGLKDGFSFACFVTLDDDVIPMDAPAFLGQGKSLFSVSFTKAENDADTVLTNEIAKKLRPDVTYCFSDSFLSRDCYSKTKFAMTDFKDYRIYTTAYAESEGSEKPCYYKSIKKGSVLYKLVRAGSIFILKDRENLSSDTYVESIGFDTFIKGGTDK